MDYLYGQLPEIVYDPADLTGKSPKGTIQLNIDNNSREILLDVLKTPGKLTIKDPGNANYIYDGSQDVTVDISNFFDINIEHCTASEEDIANHIPTATSKVGDSYLKIIASGNTTYVPLPMPANTSSDILKITSIATIYTKKEDLPQNAPIGSIYPVKQMINASQMGMVLYEKKTTGYDEKSRVSKGSIYVITELGLLAIAETNLTFTILDTYLTDLEYARVVNITSMTPVAELPNNLGASGNGAHYIKYENPNGDENRKGPLKVYSYDSSTNTWRYRHTIKGSTLYINFETKCLYRYTGKENNPGEDYPYFICVSQSPERVKELVDTTSNNLTDLIEKNRISKIEAVGRDDDITHYKVSFTDNTIPTIGFDAWTPKGDTGTLEINNVITGEPGTEASVINVNNNDFTKDSHAILDITIPQGIGIGSVENSAPRHDEEEHITYTTVTLKDNTSELNTIGTFDVGVAQGKAATIKTVSVVESLEPDEIGEVDNRGNAQEAILEFKIPRGKDSTISVGEVITGEPGTNVEITPGDKIVDSKTITTPINFKIPKGEKGETGTSVKEINYVSHEVRGDTTYTKVEVISDKEGKLNEFEVASVRGEKGDKGDAATITIGNVEVGLDNSTANVINKGNTHDAIFDFIIPKGEKGSTITGATSVREGVDDLNRTITKVTFTTNDGTPISPVTVYADKGEKGDTGTSIIGVESGEISTENGYTITPITVTTNAPENNSSTLEIKAKDGTSFSHEWDGTSLIVTSSSGTSEAIELKGEKGDPAKIEIGNVTTGLPESNVNITSSFDDITNTTTFHFSIPRGAKGEKGDAISIAKVFTSEEEMDEDINLGDSENAISAGSFVLLSNNSGENILYVKIANVTTGEIKYEYVTTLGDIELIEDLTYGINADGTITIKIKDLHGEASGTGITLTIPANLNVETRGNINYLQLTTNTGSKIGEEIALPNNIDPEIIPSGLSINPITKRLSLINTYNNAIGNSIELPETITGLASETDTDKGTVTLWLKDANGDIIEDSKTTFTGGGVGTGTGGGNYLLRFERITPTPFIITKVRDAQLKFKVYITETSTGDTLGGYGTWKIGPRILKNETFNYGVENNFDASEYVTVGTSTKVTLSIYSDEEKTNLLSTINWSILVEDIKIESESNFNRVYTPGLAIDFNYTVTGNVEKTVHFKLNGNELDTYSISTSGGTQTFEIPGQVEGSYLFEFYVTATVGTTEVETDHIYKDIIWLANDSETPIIGCDYRKDYYKNGEGVAIKLYNTFELPFYIADPKTNFPKVTKEIYSIIKDKDGNILREETLQFSEETLNGSNYTWVFKPTEIGEYTLRLKCKETSVDVLIVVDYIGFDVVASNGYKFEFNPAGRSNSNDSDKNWSSDGVSMNVSDGSDGEFDPFDWLNGGYIIDEEGNSCFLIKAGTYVKFDYKLFDLDIIDGKPYDIIKDTGAAFKIIFKTSMIKKADANFLKCISENDEINFKMNAHEAYLITNNGSLYMPYSEGDIIDFEYVINNTSNGSYIMSYEDGVAARPLIYDSLSKLYQRNPSDIFIGSKDCDIYIYKIRAYKKLLTNIDIINNFIIDAPNSDEMVARYERNQIYESKDRILNPQYLANACPDLRIILIEAPRFTTDKDDKVEDTTIQMIYKNGDPILDNWICTGAKHSGLGTSSNEYGYAGRNLDLIMDGEGALFTLGDGSIAPDNKITLTRDSVPTNYLNVKVNIASSENENNALMARRYNEFNPYKRIIKLLDSKVKDTMEFYNCVVFIKEKGNISDHKEFNDNNYHFYAIGNVGDSKKTDNTRVNDKNDAKECIIEIADYNLPLSNFPKGEGVWGPGNSAYDALYKDYKYKDGKFKSFGDSTFEFRYEKKGITQDERQLNINAWREFYEFVINSTDEDFYNNLKNYFVVDSALYYYLFTERYTMVDNRAKNSFWHYGKCEDGMYRWDLCFGYDFDTSLGIDNTGKLVLPYGKEDIDYYVKDDPNSGYVYRAADSTFFTRLRDLFSSELSAMFLDRESKLAWSASSLINQWDNYQNQFPEELWYRDIERKYLRTYKGVSLDNSIQGAVNPRFFIEMMNGRKKYQRRLFERNQEVYFASKYMSTEATSNNIMLRFNNPEGSSVDKDFKLKLTPYIDMYLGVSFANGASPKHQRVFAGIEYEIRSDLPNGDITLIYSAPYILAIGNLSKCYVGDNDFSKAVRLLRLEIGSNVSGYNSNYLRSLNLQNNKMLEYLDIRNITGFSGYVNSNSSLDLLACLNLTTLYAEGSNIQSALFANRGKLKIAHLPETLNTLELRNLMHLEDFQAHYNNLTSLTIESSNIDEKAISEQLINNGNLTELYLYGIDWTNVKSLPNTDLLNDIYDLYDSELSGNVHIAGDIGSQEIAKYAEKWEDLSVSYNNRILYYLIKYIGASGDILYSEWVRQGGFSSVYGNEFDGTINNNITIPVKESTPQYDYIFNKWSDSSKLLVTSNLDIYAEFNSTIRKYNVTWYSNELEDEILYELLDIDYGSEAIYQGSPLEGYFDIANLQSHLFLGWDNSTGYIKENLKVHPKWEITSRPTYNPNIKKFVHGEDINGEDILELNEMTPGQIHAIVSHDKLKQSGTPDNVCLWETFEAKDYIDITLGNDFTFDNVEEITIVDKDNPMYFDGTTYYKPGITLFGEESTSFTLAIDFKFLSDKRIGTLFSCFNNENAERKGFRLVSLNNSLVEESKANYPPQIEFATNSSNAYALVGNHYKAGSETQFYRGIVVIRYNKDKNELWLHSGHNLNANGNNNSVDPNINYLPSFTIKSQGKYFITPEDSLNIILGAIEDSNGNFADYGVGTINWCKLWKEDLGTDTALLIASWYREKLRMEYCGDYPLDENSQEKGRYLILKTSKEEADSESYSNSLYSSMCFIPNNLLQDKVMKMTSLPNNSNPLTVITWKEAGTTTDLEGYLIQNVEEDNTMRSLFNNRLFKSFPIVWRLIIRRSLVKYCVDPHATDSSKIDYNLYDYIYIPSIYEFGYKSSEYYYKYETTQNFSNIPFFNNDTSSNSNNKNRYYYLKFLNIITEPIDVNTLVFARKIDEEPGNDLSDNIERGCIWFRIGNDGSFSVAKIALPMDEIIKKGLKYTPVKNHEEEYGWVDAVKYPSRSKLHGNVRRTFKGIDVNGKIADSSIFNVANNYSGLLPCFSI